MPRAASCSACSAVGAGVVWEKSVTSALHCRNSSAWCTDIGAARQHADRPGRGPPSRGSTGSAARRGPSAPAAPARPAARRPARWSPAAGARRTDRPSASVTAKPSPSRSAAATSPSTTSPAVRRDLGPAAREQLGRRHARRGPAARARPRPGALRGAPASITSTDRRARASISAPLNPAAPPPITTTSYCPSSSVIVDHLRDDHAPDAAMLANFVADLANMGAWTTTSTRRSRRSGPRLRALRRQRDTTLAELSAQTGISVSTLSRLESGQPPPDPRAAAAAGPGPRRHRSTSWSAPRPPATRASTCARSPGTG